MSEDIFWEGSRCTVERDLHDWGKGWYDCYRLIGKPDRQGRVCKRCNRKEERYVGE